MYAHQNQDIELQSSALRGGESQECILREVDSSNIPAAQEKLVGK
jgi:hypothetical protein